MHDDSPSRHPRPAAPDRLAALAVFLTLGAIYVATLLPGLGGTEDTAKFQYIGPALGTPHDPGYPLYMLASWAASKVPIGTLAYRVNLLSAFWGALAAAFVFLAMRRLAVPRALAACVALGMCLGYAFWEHSTYAEVYTQASAFTAAALAALLAWDDDRRDRQLFAAVAAASLAFGTHLIIVGAVPVFAWLVLTRYRWRLPARVIAVSGLIVALGLAQYSYVWIRTAQGARYLESRATSVGELVDVLRGRQFADQTFKDPPAVIAGSRLPAIARAVGRELGPPAFAIAALGFVVLWRRRRRAAILLAGACLGPLLLLSALGDVATEGIMLPALMPLWVLAGAGAAALWSLAASVSPPRARLAAGTAVALIVAAIPATQARTNFADNNRRGETFDTDYFAALFEGLAGPTAFLTESYMDDQMLQYQRFVTRSSHVMVGVPREPERIRTLLGDGFAVYAFGDAVAQLDGRIGVRGVTLPAPSLDARLAGLPDGALVVVAGSAPRWPRLDALEAGDRGGRGIVIGLKGVGPVVVTPPEFEGAIEIARGQPLGRSGATAAMDLRVEVRGRDAAIDVDGQRVVQSTGGLAVAEMGSRFWNGYVLRPGNAYRPPFDMSRRPLYAVTHLADCAEIGEGRWVRLTDAGSTGRLVGRVDNVRPFDAEWLGYLAADRALHPALVSSFGPHEPAFEVETFVPRRDGDRLRARLAEDGLDAPDLLSAPAVTRVRVTVNDEGEEAAFRLGLGGRPAAVWARATTDRLRRGAAMICALDPDVLEPDAETQRASLYLGPGGDWLLGAGWRGAEPMPVGFQRVLRGAEGRVLLPVPEAAPIGLRLWLEPIGGDATLAVSLNGHAAVEPPRVVTSGWQELAWSFEVSPWHAGLNELRIQVTRPDGRVPAADEPVLRVRAIELDWSPRR